METMTKTETVPVVGMGCTMNQYSDRHAGTVIKVSDSGKTLLVQRDNAVLLNGVDSGASDALEFSPGGFVGHTSGTQRYSYTRDLNGTVTKYTLRTLRNGKKVYKAAGSRTGSSGGTLTLGDRSENYDFNF